MTLTQNIAKDFLKKNNPELLEHPEEISIPEKRELETVFSFEEEIEAKIAEKYGNKPRKLPESILYFQEKWIFGVSQEKTILMDAKKIYNCAIQDCIKRIKKEYDFTNDNGFVDYMKSILEENMIKE